MPKCPVCSSLSDEIQDSLFFFIDCFDHEIFKIHGKIFIERSWFIAKSIYFHIEKRFEIIN